MPDKVDTSTGARPFWSGSIAFGLVSVPVTLYVGLRASRVRLRMVDEEGTPLRRRYYCSRDEQLLERDDIVRGYEVEKDHFVVVEDEELEALAPEKSREIDLKRFVGVDDVDPIYFERSYYLAPEERAVKAYRLLARVLESKRRAGIATFVMRGKEYLVAILAEGGILRAETLRFHDEVRSPEDVGLPAPGKAAGVGELKKARKKLYGKTMPGDVLDDEWSERVRRLVKKKQKAGDDVRSLPERETESDDDEPESAEIIDLMALLEKRLSGGGSADDLEDQSKDELYDRARALDIEGRSSMTKSELIAAIRAAGQ